MIVKNFGKQSLKRVRNIKFQGIKTIPCRVLWFMRVQGSSKRGNLWKYLRAFFGRSRITGSGRCRSKLTSYWRLMNHFVALALASAACATNFSSRRAQTSFGCIQESAEWRKDTKDLEIYFLGSLRNLLLSSCFWKPLKSVWRRCMVWRCCEMMKFWTIFAIKRSSWLAVVALCINNSINTCTCMHDAASRESFASPFNLLSLCTGYGIKRDANIKSPNGDAWKKDEAKRNVD